MNIFYWIYISGLRNYNQISAIFLCILYLYGYFNLYLTKFKFWVVNADFHYINL